MEVINYSVTLTGVGVLHTPKVKLENIEVNLVSNDLRKWECKEASIPVDGKLNVELACFAVSGTDWSLKVKNEDHSKIVLDTAGTTGSNPNKPNRSDEKFSADPE